MSRKLHSTDLIATTIVEMPVSTNAVISIVGRKSYGENILVAPIGDNCAEDED